MAYNEKLNLKEPKAPMCHQYLYGKITVHAPTFITQAAVNVLFYTMIYYPTALRRVQITPKTSTNITRYLYSRGPVKQVSCR